MNTCPETSVPLVHCVIDDTLFQATPDLRQMLLQFIDVTNLTSVANVSMHAAVPQEDIIAFNVTQESRVHTQLRLLSRRSRQRERLSTSMLSICLFVCLFVCLSPKCKKTRFSQKLNNLELLRLLTTYRKSYMDFPKNPLLDP